MEEAKDDRVDFSWSGSVAESQKPLSQDEIRQIYRKALTLPSGNEKQACLDIWRYYGRG